MAKPFLVCLLLLMDPNVTNKTMDEKTISEIAERAANAAYLTQRESFQQMLDNTLPGVVAGYLEKLGHSHQTQQ